MPPVPLAARVVEVIADLGETAHPRFRYGSGFIVRAGTVLTAAHVVADAKSISVRDPDKRVFPASADPRFTGDARGPGPDLALLEIDHPEPDLPQVGLARVDRDSPSGKPVEGCQVIGYPAFMEHDTPDGGQIRETAHATGHVPVLEGLAGGLLSVQVTHKPRPLPPEETALGNSPWSGMSGAPVLAGGLLLGVVSEHAPREGSSTITATPLTALEADPAHPGWGPGVTNPAWWWARLGVAGISALRRLPCLPDQAGIPLPVPYEVRRPHLLDQVIAGLLGDLSRPGSEWRPIGLVGMGGSGKSVLAAAAARDPRVRDAFPDGRFWLELGPDPPLLQLQASLAAALGDSTPITDVPQGRARLSRLLAERCCLLVLDNVWDPADLAAFPVPRPTGELVTTRDAATVPGAASIVLEELAPEAALQLLAGWTATPAGQLPAEAALAARECGYLPLALALCGAMIATGDYGWPGLLDLLHRADLGALRSRLVDYPHRSLAVALAASLGTLSSDARDLYMRLAVFNTEGPVPQAALQLLWGLGEQDTAALVSDLAAKSLLRAEASWVSLHDLQMDYLVRAAEEALPALHEQLLAGYRGQCRGGWAAGPDDGYFRQHLARHLHHAGRIPELRSLLLDLDWMSAKLTARDVSGLLADYATLPSDPAARMAGGALRLSAHVLADDPGQLPGQLTGRLSSQRDPQLQDLLQRTFRWTMSPWLRPLTASLTPPGGPLLRILTGHDGAVEAVAVSADGRRAVSGGNDRTVRVWDLEEGTAVHTLTGHRDSVMAVAVSADGRRAVSGGRDGTLRVWDLEEGAAVHTLTGHGHGRLVMAVAVTPDGRRAVSGGNDGTVRVWDLEEGTAVRTLIGHVRAVWAVAVSADGRRAVSGGSDGTVQAWDLEEGTVVHTLTGHDGAVEAVAVSADGRRTVSGGHDGTVRAWDLEDGTAVHTLTGHDWVQAVAVTPDGGRAVSGGQDGTVRAWDLEAGMAVHTLTGHRGKVEAVVVSADGRSAVSGGRDGTVRVWDPESGMALHTLTGHRGWVDAVAVTPDGRRAVSGGSDKDETVRVWDLEAGTAVHTLTGHRGRADAVAVTPDGRRAVSGGVDGTVRVWDLEAGTAVLTLTGAHDVVSAVVVTPDGRRVVSGGWDGTVRVWDLATGKQIASVIQRLQNMRIRSRSQGFFDRINSLSISADGRRAVSGGNDRTLRVWDPESGKAVHTLTGHRGNVEATAVTADGRRAVSGGEDETVRVWDLETGTAVHTLTGHHGNVSAVAVSPDGRLAVSGGEDRMVRVWNVAHGVELASFASDSSITVLAVTPPGTRVIAGTSAGPVHFLELCAYQQPSANTGVPTVSNDVRSNVKSPDQAVGRNSGGARTDRARAARLLSDAERIAQSITDQSSRARAFANIAETLAAIYPVHAALLIADADRIAQSITDTKEKDSALARIARALAATAPDRAERTAQSITDEFDKSWALADVTGGLAAIDPNRAARTAQSITSEGAKDSALARIAETLATTDPDGAERVISSIADLRSKSRPLAEVARSVALTDPDRAARLIADAERAARSTTMPDWRTSALLALARSVAAIDPERAARLIDDAEHAAESITDEFLKALALSKVASSVGAIDPERAARLNVDAQQVADSVANELQKAVALSEVARSVAATDPDRAERIAEPITEQRAKARALSGVAKALAVTDPDRAERTAQSITDEDWRVITLIKIAKVDVKRESKAVDST